MCPPKEILQQRIGLSKRSQVGHHPSEVTSKVILVIRASALPLQLSIRRPGRSRSRLGMNQFYMPDADSLLLYSRKLIRRLRSTAMATTVEKTEQRKSMEGILVFLCHLRNFYNCQRTNHAIATEDVLQWVSPSPLITIVGGTAVVTIKCARGPGFLWMSRPCYRFRISQRAVMAVNGKLPQLISVHFIFHVDTIVNNTMKWIPKRRPQKLFSWRASRTHLQCGWKMSATNFKRSHDALSSKSKRDRINVASSFHWSTPAGRL